MKTYAVTVKRMQVWRLEVEAADADEAKDRADAMAADEPIADDYAYSTDAKEIS